MIQFYLLGFPVQIQPFFWITCFLFGGGVSARSVDDFFDLVNWAVVLFLSILLHELGHAVAGRHFGARPEISLHGMGGVTSLPGASFNRWQSIVVSAAGPAVSLVLGAAFIAAFIFAGPEPPRQIQTFIGYGLLINLLWMTLNLLPIQPLDGGQIFRDLLGPSRFKITCWVGAITAGALCLGALMLNFYFLGLFAAFLAWCNYKGRDGVPGGIEK